MDDSSSSLSSSSDDFPTPQGNRWHRLRAERGKTTGNGASTLRAIPRATRQTTRSSHMHVHEEVATQRKLYFDGASTVCSIDVDNTCDTTTEEMHAPPAGIRQQAIRAAPPGDKVREDSLSHILGAQGEERAAGYTSHSSGGLVQQPQPLHVYEHKQPRLSEAADVRSATASTVDAASSMTPQKDPQQVIEQQEARIRELVRVLQEASAEIRKERQLRERLKEENDRLRNGREGLSSAALVEAKAENDRLMQEIHRLKASGERQAETYLQKMESMRNALQHVEVIREEEALEAVRNREQIEELQKEIRHLKESAKQRVVHKPDVSDDALLVERMKRALAPPPAPESMSVLIDSMVRELRRQWKEENKELPLIKRGRNLYSYGDKKLNLQLVNGKLAYRVGGGHRDLLAFLESQERSQGLRTVMVIP